jgi:hypothetical protein
MTHLLKFHGCFNIFVPKVLSFIKTLEEFFNENYIDANKI